MEDGLLRIQVWADPPPPIRQLNHANSADFGAISANFPQFRHSTPSFCKSWIQPCMVKFKFPSCQILQILCVAASSAVCLQVILKENMKEPHCFPKAHFWIYQGYQERTSTHYLYTVDDIVQNRLQSCQICIKCLASVMCFR